MFEHTVSLSNFTKLKKLVEFAGTKEFDITLAQGDITADAKNINEVFSLDLTKPAVLIAKTDGMAMLSRELKQKGLI